MEPQRDRVFISYSHKDQKFLDELLTHLKPLERLGRISAWSDKQIEPGSSWFEEIQESLIRTRVAVLLVTKDFLASDFIHEHELGPLLKRAEQGGVRILWVLVRACSYGESVLTHYQAILPPDKPLAEMRAERDKAWVRVCEAIKQALTTTESMDTRSSPKLVSPTLREPQITEFLDFFLTPAGVPLALNKLLALGFPRMKTLEGVWRTDENSTVCMKVIDNELRVPYCYGGSDRLTSHYYGCKIYGELLFGRFEWFMDGGLRAFRNLYGGEINGIIALHLEESDLLRGRWWWCGNDKVQFQRLLMEELGMTNPSDNEPQPHLLTLHRDFNAIYPAWAEEYFRRYEAFENV